MVDVKLTARHILGVAILGVVVMMWVASSFLMRSIFGEDKSYDKPFLVTWINTGTFSLYLIPWTIRNALSRRSSRRVPGHGTSTPDVTNAKSGNDSRSDHSDIVQSEGFELTGRSARSPLLEADRRGRHHGQDDGGDGRVDIVDDEAAGTAATRPLLTSANSMRTFGSHDVTLEVDSTPLTTMETAQLGCVFSMLWFAANYFGNLSLSYTNVASFTIISSLSGFFTLVLGTVLGVETFTMGKLYALIVSVLGVILVTAQDSAGSDAKDFLTDLIIGDILALVGAALYGCYTVFLKFKVRNEERVSMTLFFGFVGVFNLLVLWPIIILLNVTGLEPFELPSTGQIWLVVAANAAITFVSDYLWVLAMLMTSPLVVTVGISMSIPLALIGDHFLYPHVANFWFFAGAAMVFGSFIAVNLTYEPDRDKLQTSQRRTRDAVAGALEVE